MFSKTFLYKRLPTNSGSLLYYVVVIKTPMAIDQPTYMHVFSKLLLLELYKRKIL